MIILACRNWCEVTEIPATDHDVAQLQDNSSITIAGKTVFELLLAECWFLASTTVNNYHKHCYYHYYHYHS